MDFVASNLPNNSSMESLCDNLVINAIFLMVPFITSGAHKSTDDQGDYFVVLLCVYAVLIRYLVRVYDSFQSKGLLIYMDTVVPVVIAFALLLVINLQYYILVPFPVCSVCFIVYICNKILVKESLQQTGSGSQDKDTKQSDQLVGASTDQPSKLTDGSGKNSKRKEVKITVAVPYSMLVISALYGGSNPVLSHFLIFSCCVLWTLAVMYSRLVDYKGRALEPALECIQMAYMVMLFITVHTVAAEWLGEVTALVCMPELMAWLVWFSTLLHSDPFRPCSVSPLPKRIGEDLKPPPQPPSVTSDEDRISSGAPDATETRQVSSSIFKDSMVIPLGAVLAGLIASTYELEEEEGELLASWNTKAAVACGTAGCMPYLSVWMISRWPGSIPSSDEVTRLLKFPANICLTGACLLLLALLAEKTSLLLLAADRLFGLDDLSLLKYLPGFYFTAAAALLVKHLVAP